MSFRTNVGLSILLGLDTATVRRVSKQIPKTKFRLVLRYPVFSRRERGQNKAQRKLFSRKLADVQLFFNLWLLYSTFFKFIDSSMDLKDKWNPNGFNLLLIVGF